MGGGDYVTHKQPSRALLDLATGPIDAMEQFQGISNECNDQCTPIVDPVLFALISLDVRVVYMQSRHGIFHMDGWMDGCLL